MGYDIDIRTLSFASGIISLVLCICMISIRRTRRVYNGFTPWTISSILNCLGFLLLSLRGFLPAFITVVTANTLILGSIGILAFGIEIFVDSKKRTWLYLLFVLFLFLSFIYFTYFSPNIPARIIILSAMFTILYGYCGCLLCRYIAGFKAGQSWLLIVVLFILAVWNLFRTITTILSNYPIVDFMQAPIIHGVTFVVLFSGNIFIILGLIMLNVQRVENDLAAAKNEVKTLTGIIPICMHCKGIRDDKGSWSQLEEYIGEHSDAQFSHGICEKCLKKHYPDKQTEIK